MTAISVSWTAQTAAQTDADSPVNQILMDGYRKNLVHLREWMGAGYTGGAVQDHNHDGINTRFSFPTLAVGEFTAESFTTSENTSFSGAKYYKTLTINHVVSPGDSTNGVLVIFVEGTLTIGAAGKLDLKGYGGAGAPGGDNGNGSQGQGGGPAGYGGAGKGGGGGGGETSGGTGGNGGQVSYNGSVLSWAAGGLIDTNGSDGSDASINIKTTNYPLLQMFDPFHLAGSGGGGGGGGATGGETGHAGGNGGGVALIVCDSLVMASGSEIDLRGDAAATGGSGSGSGGGGGGGGGCCIIMCNSITDSGVSWLHDGGAGSAHIGPASAGDGGDGGKGIHVIADYSSPPMTVSDTDT